MIRFLLATISLFLSSCSQGAPVEPMLIGGRIPDKADFQAVIWSGGCTASVVGPRVILLAAHCVNTSMTFSVGRDKLASECMVPLEYTKGDISADFALCYLSSAVSGIPFENVNIDETIPAAKDTVLLSGFGCTRKGGAADGVFRVGEAVVTNTRSSSGSAYFETGRKVLLCPGDSGGPAWSLDVRGSRTKIIGVNSRSDQSQVSLIAGTGSRIFNRFYKAWQARYKEAQICGIDPIKGCLNEVQAPENKFEIDHSLAKVTVEMKEGASAVLEKLKASFQKALDSVLVPSL